jgi:hypothetical protein
MRMPLLQYLQHYRELLIMNTESTRQLLITFVPSILVLLVVLGAHLVFNINVSQMTKDVAAIASIHPLSGFLSNLGILLWCSTASICFFSAMTIRNVMPRDSFRFLLSSALLSTYLLLDDFFQFHEALAIKYLGLSETIIFAVLAIFISAYLVSFRRTILQTNFCFLLLALSFLAASVALDMISEQGWLIGEWEYFLEDGAKWLGIASWSSYYVHTSYQFLSAHLALSNASDRKL